MQPHNHRNAPALELRGVARSFRAGIRGCSANVSVLTDVNLTVDSGEIVGVIAGPGTGKTTLLLCAAGLLRPDVGSVRWFGTAGLLRPPGVTLCSDRPAPFAFLTVREALEYHLMVHDLAADDRDLRIAGTIARAALRADANTRVAHLSVEAQRRMTIAQAMLMNPRLVLIDGLLADLEGGAARCMHEIIGSLAADGVAVVLAERDLQHVSELATRVAWLARGTISDRRPTASRRRLIDLNVSHPEDREAPPLVARVGEASPGMDANIG